jgi:hypothetical protein
MRVRKLDANGDMTFGSGLINFYQDEALGVAQVVKTTLLLWAGEWYLDLDAGVPYLESILGKHSQPSADAAIQYAILNVDGVTSIERYSSVVNPNTRAFSVSLTLDTIYGPTDLEVSNYGNF